MLIEFLVEDMLVCDADFYPEMVFKKNEHHCDV